MSVTGISSSGFFQPNSTQQNTSNNFQRIQSEFLQLGQDLQSGHLTQAQQDFAALAPAISSGQQNGTSTSSNPLSSDFGALGKALQSGSLATAQQAYTALEQDIQLASGASGIHHHHRHSQDSQSSATGQQSNPIAQLFGQLGQALQAGGLTAAQLAYSTMQQDLAVMGGGSSAGAQIGGGGLSFAA